MVSEKRIKLMTKLASYEEGEGREDLKISAYHRKDYTSFQTLVSIIWFTIGYVIIAGFAVVILMNGDILNHMSFKMLIELGIGIVGLYLSVVLIGGILAYSFYKRKYIKAYGRAKRYNHNLLRLLDMYQKEKE